MPIFGDSTMYASNISDLRRNVRALIDASQVLRSFCDEAPQNAEPKIIALYNALLDVIKVLNQELDVEEEGMEDVSDLSYLEELGISATVSFEQA